MGKIKVVRILKKFVEILKLRANYLLKRN